MSAASDRASIAADAVAWAIMGIPTQLEHKAVIVQRASQIIRQYRDHAESDPNTFTQDLFSSLADIVQEYERDLAGL